MGRSQGVPLDLLEEALRSTEELAERVKGSDARSRLPVSDAALAPGRLTGLNGSDEVIWLRACLTACTLPGVRSEGGHDE